MRIAQMLKSSRCVRLHTDHVLARFVSLVPGTMLPVYIVREGREDSQLGDWSRHWTFHIDQLAPISPYSNTLKLRWIREARRV